MDSPKEKPFLLAAFGFPPRAGSGIQRVVRFTQILPECGWRPEILTVSRWGNDISDETWERKIPQNLKIHRIPSLDPFRIALALKSRDSRPDTILNSEGKSTGAKNGALGFLKSLYYKLSIPDHAVWWVPGAVLYGLYIISKHSPKLIFTTSGPYGVALAGLILKKLTGLPWALEFRDPWSKHTMTKMSDFRKRLESAMERMCVKNADAVIATTPLTSAEFHSVTPDAPQDKFVTITNGFHLPEFAAMEPRPAAGRFIIVFTGMFYGSRSPEYFFSALAEACRRNRELKDKLRVVFAGTLSNSHRNLLNEEPLKSLVDTVDYVSHDEVIGLLASADALFLYLSKEEEEIYPAKLFEYLAARRFILAAVPPQGITAEVIHRFEAGIVTAPDDIEEMTEALLKMYDDFKAGRLRTKHSLEDIAEFSWPGLVRKLADVFEQITARSGN